MLKDIGKKKYITINKEPKNKFKQHNKSVDYTSKKDDIISQEKILENKLQIINKEKNDKSSTMSPLDLSTMGHSNFYNSNSTNNLINNDKYTNLNYCSKVSTSKLNSLPNESIENDLIKNIFMKNNKISYDKSKNNKKLNHSMIEDKSNRKYNINKFTEEKIHNSENSSLINNKTKYNNDIIFQKLKRRTLRNSLKTIHNSNSVILNDKEYFNNMQIMINDIHMEGF